MNSNIALLRKKKHWSNNSNWNKTYDIKMEYINWRWKTFVFKDDYFFSLQYILFYIKNHAPKQILLHLSPLMMTLPHSQWGHCFYLFLVSMGDEYSIKWEILPLLLNVALVKEMSLQLLTLELCHWNDQFAWMLEKCGKFDQYSQDPVFD